MLKRIGAESTGELKAIASGTLPSGRPVIVNSDGTVSLPVATTASAGTAVVFESATSNNIDVGYDSNSNKVVVAYRDEGNSNRGTAIVGTVNSSDNSISFGSPELFNVGNTTNINVTFDTTNNKVVIIYTDNSSGSRGNGVVGTVSGTSISFGSEAHYVTDRTDYQSVTFDSANGKVVVAFQNIDESDRGQACVGTVSGTSITWGTPVNFETDSTYYTACTFDSTNSKVVIAYRNHPDSAGNVIVGSVSGTSISFGSATVYSTDHVRDQGIAFDPVNNKVVIVFRDEGNSDVGTAVVGTVSGTSISVGSKVVYFSSRADNNDINYNTAAGKFMITFIDDSGTPVKAIGASINGTSLDVDSSTVTIDSSGAAVPRGVYDANAGRIVVAWSDSTNSGYGTASVVTTGFDTLTSENYIGMSRGFANPAVAGSKVTFESSAMGSEHIGMVYDPDVGRIIIAYQDEGNSFYGQAIVGTVSGTSISFGTPVVFESAKSKDFFVAYDTANDKVVIAFCDEAGSDYGTAIVGTVSGTSISFGSPTVLNTQNTQIQGCVYDANSGKTVVFYRDSGTSNRGTAIVGTVSGTSISFGTEVRFNGNNASYNIKAIYDSSAQKVVVAFMDGNNSNYGTAAVGTVSGTSISFGSAATYNSSSTSDVGIVYDPVNNKSVITYKDGGNGDKGMAVVGTVSGTSISFGTPVQFDSRVVGNFDPTYHSPTGQIVINYISYTPSGKGRFVTGKVSGTTIGSFSSPVAYYSDDNAVIRPSVIVDGGTNNLVFAWKENTGSTGSAVVHSVDVRGEVASGQPASIDVIGSVSNNQSGLTTGQQYFVQTDGTISETAGSPSVLAGTAISATKLIVKT